MEISRTGSLTCESKRWLFWFDIHSIVLLNLTLFFHIVLFNLALKCE